MVHKVTIWTYDLHLLLQMFMFIFLNFNDSESVMLSFRSTFQLCSAAIIFLMFLQTYCCTLLDYTSTSKHSDLLNVTYLFLSSGFLVTTSAPAPVIFRASLQVCIYCCNQKELTLQSCNLEFWWLIIRDVE